MHRICDQQLRRKRYIGHLISAIILGIDSLFGNDEDNDDVDDDDHGQRFYSST